MTLKDRYFKAFAGSALGTAVGDALGRGVEGWSREAIRGRFGVLEEMQTGRYTDDTQMMIGLMEALLESPQFDPEVAARKFLENFEPSRGSGARVYKVMERLRRGVPWHEAGTDSWGNGAAMRVAPLGFYYFDRREDLLRAVISSATITHRHPDGIGGALAQAMTVAIATREGLAGKALDREAFVEEVAAGVRPISPKVAREVERIREILETTRGLPEKISLVAEAFPCDVSAPGAVPAAISAFLLADTFKEAVVIGVNAGGDTDTIGAMAGAAAGAYWGLDAIPKPWIEALEEGEKGRSYILRLARELAALKAKG